MARFDAVLEALLASAGTGFFVFILVLSLSAQFRAPEVTLFAQSSPVTVSPSPVPTPGLITPSSVSTRVPVLATVDAILTSSVQPTGTLTPPAATPEPIRQSATATASQPTPTVATSTPRPIPSPSARPAATTSATTRKTLSPRATQTATPALASLGLTPHPIGYVGHTGGSGTYLRHSAQFSDHWLLLPDTTPLVLLGSQAEREGELWIWVSDPSGNVGWVQAQYVVR